MIHEFVLEVCVASTEDAIAARDGGADRLELNMAIELGGLTPTVGLLREVKQAVDLPVITMIRPRSAGFRYSPRECQLMLRDAELLLEWGADGVALGALLADGNIDCSFLNEARRLSSGRDLVFHRAFDLLANPEAALQQLIACGTTRVLTAGGCVTAAEGSHQILQLQQLAAQQIEILPGGGITPDNVSELIRATGCRQVHGTFRTLKQDQAGRICGPDYPSTCQVLVAQTRDTLDRIARQAQDHRGS